MSKQSKEAVARYYSRLGTRLGYLLVMGRSQHFGFYESENFTEQQAQQKYHEKLAKLLDLRASMRVLDAGCGQGVVACFLAQNYNVEISGITIVPHEVKTASARAQSTTLLGKTKFVLADYNSPPFEKNTFDRVYTTESLSHAVDVQESVCALAEVLKPGGRAVFAEYMIDYTKFDAEDKHAADFVKKYGAIHGIYQFGEGQFVGYLKKAGLVFDEEHDWTDQLKPSFDRLRRLAKPMVKVVSGLRLERFFINTLAAQLYSDYTEKGVFRYKVYVAKKPKK